MFQFLKSGQRWERNKKKKEDLAGTRGGRKKERKEIHHRDAGDSLSLYLDFWHLCLKIIKIDGRGFNIIILFKKNQV